MKTFKCKRVNKMFMHVAQLTSGKLDTKLQRLGKENGSTRLNNGSVPPSLRVMETVLNRKDIPAVTV